MNEGATLVFNAGDNTPRNLLVEGGYLYASLWDFGGGISKVVKVEIASFTLVSTLIITALDGKCAGMVVSGNYLYVAVADGPGHVAKVDLATFTVVDFLTVPGPGAQQVFQLATDGTFLYATTYQGTNNLFKISLATFAIVDTLAIADGGGGKHPLIYNGFLYIPSGNIITKVNLTTFAVAAILDLLVVFHDDAALARVGDFLFQTDNGNPGLMSKVDLTTFTKVGELTLNSQSPRDLVLIYLSLYTCHFGSNEIIQVNPDTLLEVEVLTLSAAASALNCLAGNSLFVGSSLSPGKVTMVTVPSAPPTPPATTIPQVITLPATVY